LRSLEREHLGVSIFAGVEADPPESVVAAAVRAARTCHADCIVGFGGGSSLDVAKLTALLAGSGESLSDVIGINRTRGPRLTLLLVPTTAGTGSEVTAVSVVTTQAGEKQVVVSPLLLPDLALLDAELTLGLPMHVTAATGIDAIVHAIEAFTSRRLKNPISDGLACKALDLLSSNLLTACHNGADVDARENMLVGACLAGMAFANAPVAAVHALAYPIGARFHVPHGVSNALVLAPVLRFNVERVARLYARLAEIMLPGIGGSPASKVATLIAYLEGLPGSLGLPTRLRDVGIERGDIEFLATDAMNQTRLLANNPREVSLEDARAIYQAVL
jgi:alcohol dehydrogenase class IV